MEHYSTPAALRTFPSALESVSLNAEALFAAYHSSPVGLSSTVARERLQLCGENCLVTRHSSNLLGQLIANFVHLMALLLWAGGAIAILAQMPQVGAAIWMVNVVNGCFSFWQEFKAEKAAEALAKLVPHFVVVRRDNVDTKLPATQVVPGDIISVSAGEKIPADARILRQSSLSVDESVLTGESHSKWKDAQPGPPVKRIQDASNMLLAGSTVTGGNGKALVVATGASTAFGQVAQLAVGVREDLSPLQKEMQRLTRQISLIAVSVGAIMFLCAALFVRVSIAQSFLFALGMIVAFVPEGMVPTITLSLAIVVERMSRENALIKKLSSVETLGCTTVICTDKTGTLTEGKMSVQRVWIPDADEKRAGTSLRAESRFFSEAVGGTSGAIVTEFWRSVCLCNNAEVVEIDTQSLHSTVYGDAIESGLLLAATAAGVNHRAIRDDCPRVAELPFDSRRKRMSTVNEVRGDVVAYVKGAPQELLRRCEFLYCGDKSRVELSEQLRAVILSQVDGMCAGGLRVLGLARRSMPRREQEFYSIGAVEKELEFLALIAFLDPARQEVKTAVDACHQAGIRVVMLTGDHALTAEAIARHVDIIEQGPHCVVGGDDLDMMTNDDLYRLLDKQVLFARVSPHHKLRIVQAFQKLGHVVAVTGDGVNDAPALKQADIGIAMGCRGTDVARAAADLILLDDNFVSLVKAIELGRAVYANIRKFAVYVFTSNVAEAAPFAVMLFSRGAIPLPLNLMQVLAVDLGTDMLPAIGLGADDPQPGLMSEKPRSLKEPLLNRALLLKALLWYGVLEAIAGLSCFFFSSWLSGWPGVELAAPDSAAHRSATSATLLGIVACQIVIAFACRSRTETVFSRSIFRNRLLWAGIVLELCLVAAVLCMSCWQNVFDTNFVDLRVVGFAFFCSVMILFIDEVRKLFLRRIDGRTSASGKTITRLVDETT